MVASTQITPPWTDVWQPLQWLGLASRAHVEGGLDVVHLHVSFWLMLPGAALVAALCGILFGAPTLRLRGDYLAIVTLGFGEIVPIVVRNTPDWTNGPMGLNGVISPQVFGFRFGVTSTPYYYLAAFLVALLVFVSYRLKDSRIGRAWMAIREDEIAAGAMGVNRTRLKLMAFSTPDMFQFPVSVMVLVMIVLGGMGSVPGVVLGALILQLLQSWFLQDLTQWVHALGRLVGSEGLQQVELVQTIELIFGIILVLMMLYRREGLIPASRTTASLSLTEQAAMPSRGGIGVSLSGIRAVQLPAGTPMLEVLGLTKRFGGITAVKDLGFTIDPRTVVGLIGPNGSGKTTFFNLVTGLDTPDSGRVFFMGEDITGLPSHTIVERGIARTFQTLRLFANMTVLENVLVGMHARTRANAVGAVLLPPSVRAEEHGARAWAMEVLAIFGNRLLPRVNHLAGSLSYANRRRLEIARAVAARPRLLLLDEPTAGMNPAETMELAEQIRSLNKMGLTVLLIEHKLNVVNTISDKVAVLDYGEKIAEGRVEEVHRNEDVIRAYLGRTAAAGI
ncbi:MAG: branched-chain amino acid ABC transporter ATP-binding protein/permease [Bacillati bacterium ANGP1]|uniref:Branched-chain amino acid ABC transporter ATP-binding protein/permease n=1 Tax=Candidatus Segetimicrobium genomatis TaxID=2569760 RepID=A0A537JC09_9BACT|nr:MAG: branched-chain amino acid ABC transporter ATP-binding protein/permease [Terrabacteria group bacterium ANGP1]